jgi:prepilin-type N-terminal cleavage/methylation domain-containing protein
MNGVTTWDEVPIFDSDDAEAAFWADNRVDVRLMDSSVASGQEASESVTITLRMDPRMLARIKRLARMRYLNYQSMMKQWLSERMEQELRDASRNQPAVWGQTRQGFTLIELLVVISIIAVLASFVVGLAPLAGRKAKEASVRAELNRLVTAIEGYRARFGHYPPDHVVTLDPVSRVTNVNPVLNPLYYELSGTVVDNVNRRFCVPAKNVYLSGLQVQTAFRRAGFVNVAEEVKQVRSFMTVKERQVKEVPTSQGAVELLAVPVDWPLNRADQPTLAKGVNPWRYVSTNPTNNPQTFDLWAEVVLGKEVRVIGNWKE